VSEMSCRGGIPVTIAWLYVMTRKRVLSTSDANEEDPR
jgi:hypothetical protein